MVCPEGYGCLVKASTNTENKQGCTFSASLIICGISKWRNYTYREKNLGNGYSDLAAGWYKIFSKWRIFKSKTGISTVRMGSVEVGVRVTCQGKEKNTKKWTQWKNTHVYQPGARSSENIVHHPHLQVIWTATVLLTPPRSPVTRLSNYKAISFAGSVL